MSAPTETEKLIISKIERMNGGVVPIGTLDLMRILTHPDVISLMRWYVAEKSV